MSIYQSKGKEELAGTLSSFEENYKNRHGQELNLEELAQMITERRKKKEAEIFEGTFGTLAPSDLSTLVSLIEEKIQDRVLAQSKQKPAQNHHNGKSRKAT